MEDVILTPELQRLRLDEVPAEYRQTVISLLRSSMAENTRRSYAGHLRRFFAWAGSRGLAAWPVSPEAAIAWLAELQKRGVSVSYAEAAMAALKKLHVLHGMASPTDEPVVTAALKGFARENENSRRPAAAATADIVKELIFAVSWAPKYHEARRARDSALLILGFLGAFRRSELCALKIRDLEWTAGKDGKEILLIRIGHSKNDPEGQKALTKAFFQTDDPRFDPLILTRGWLEFLPGAAPDSPLFRGIRTSGMIQDTPLEVSTVRQILQRAEKLAGISGLSPHSLRAGFVTEAIRQGRSERSIMNQTGHSSYEAMRQYFRRENAVEDNAAQGLM